MSQPAKRKVSTKSLHEKYKALKEIENGLSKKEAASKYNVALNTISTWLKNKEKIINAITQGKNPKTKNLKGGSYDKLDQAMYKYFLNVRSHNIPVSGPMLKEKAMAYARQLQIADFKGSDGWLDRWKTRHGITFKTVAGEASSCTPEMTASWEQTTLPTILSSYNLADIYNADEFGLFYQALPERSLHLKSEKCVGGKHSKIRLTGMAAANALGEKLPMFVIGKSVKPWCFSGVQNIPCRYRAQKKSWMDGVLFEEWIRELDSKFEREGRKVVLIVDNCPAHPRVKDLKAINLVFLPPSTTSKTQPMDQGVIRALKAHYRSKAVQMYITAIENNRPIPNISILVAMDMLVAAWDKVTPGTINNCFRAAGISHQSQESAISDDDDPFKTLAEEINNLKERVPELAPENVTADIVVECDDDAATSEADPLTDEDILSEFNHSADANEEEEEEMDEDETVIVDEPPKPPTQCELRHAIGVLNTFSFFADDAHLDNLRKSTRNISQIIDQSFSNAKRQQVITNYFS